MRKVTPNSIVVVTRPFDTWSPDGKPLIFVKDDILVILDIELSGKRVYYDTCWSILHPRLGYVQAEIPDTWVTPDEWPSPFDLKLRGDLIRWRTK